MEKLKIYKIGGNIVDNPAALSDFAQEFAKISGFKLLVHGGGKIASKLSQSLGIEAKMVNGRRITDPQTLEIVTMAYAGGVNKNVVSKLQINSCNAIGLSGADAKLIVSNRRAVGKIDYGEVGDPVSVNGELVKLLLNSGYTPVVAPITISQTNTLLNTNADTVAQTLATHLSKLFDVELNYVFEKDGVLDSQGDVISRIDSSLFAKLVESGEVTDGMIPKIENALSAIAQGVELVKIGKTEIFE